jgi:hypothetical protein
MHPRLVFVCALIFAAVLAAATGVRADSRYAAVYTTTRPGADSTQELTLVLGRNGLATLTTRYPDLERTYGPRVLPIREVGKWRDRGAMADVHFTSVGLLRDGKLSQARRADKRIVFALEGCRLTATRYSKVTYGEAGLTMDKAGCKT